eukprot:8382898-Alexandrium_andersonii.AAC.1
MALKFPTALKFRTLRYSEPGLAKWLHVFGTGIARAQDRLQIQPRKVSSGGFGVISRAESD